MATATAALDSARTYLNDVGKQFWTDAALIPFLKEAHGDLQLSLWLNGLPVLKKKSATINIAIGEIDLGVNQPSDLVEPIELKERAQGSSDDWLFMTEDDFEPDITQDEDLRYWVWREEKINFVGATTAREIYMRYWATFATITAAGSPLGFLLAEVFLGPQTAQYAARSVGNITMADEALAAAREKLDLIIRANVKGLQNLPARRIPYRRFHRSRLYIGG